MSREFERDQETIQVYVLVLNKTLESAKNKRPSSSTRHQ
jgi:hypothetical protein